jgi:hypothetical protein
LPFGDGLRCLDHRRLCLRLRPEEKPAKRGGECSSAEEEHNAANAEQQEDAGIASALPAFLPIPLGRVVFFRAGRGWECQGCFAASSHCVRRGRTLDWLRFPDAENAGATGATEGLIRRRASRAETDATSRTLDQTGHGYLARVKKTWRAQKVVQRPMFVGQPPLVNKSNRIRNAKV